MRRTMASSLGKMLTTSVSRLISHHSVLARWRAKGTITILSLVCKQPVQLVTKIHVGELV